MELRGRRECQDFVYKFIIRDKRGSQRPRVRSAILVRECHLTRLISKKNSKNISLEVSMRHKIQVSRVEIGFGFAVYTEGVHGVRD